MTTTKKTAKKSSKKVTLTIVDALTPEAKVLKAKADAKAKRIAVTKAAKKVRDAAIDEIIKSNVRCLKVLNVETQANECKLGDDDLGRKYAKQMVKVCWKLNTLRHDIAKELYLESTKADREAVKKERDDAKVNRKATLKQKKLDKIKALQAEIDSMD